MFTVEQFYNEEARLPTPPSIAIAILDATRDANSSISEVAQIISADPALTTRVLSIANSSLYNLRRPVNSIGFASVLLGEECIRNIALSFVIMDSFLGEDRLSFDIDRFWRKAITSAVSAEILASEVHLCNPDIFIMALLQNIGVLVLFLSDPHQYKSLLESCEGADEKVVAEEKRLYGFTHAELGGVLLEKWGISELIHQPIFNHHSADRLNESRSAASVISLCNEIAEVIHEADGLSQLGAISRKLCNFHNLSAKAVWEMLDKIATRSYEMITSLSIDPASMLSAESIVKEAKEILGDDDSGDDSGNSIGHPEKYVIDASEETNAGGRVKLFKSAGKKAKFSFLVNLMRNIIIRRGLKKKDRDCEENLMH